HVRLWTRTGSPLAELTVSAGPIKQLAWSPKGEALVTVAGRKTLSPPGTTAEGGTLQCWTREGKLRFSLPGEGLPEGEQPWSPDAKLLGTWPHGARLHKADGELLARLQDFEGRIHYALWRPDGALLATTGPDETIRLWSAQGKLLYTLEGH